MRDFKAEFVNEMALFRSEQSKKFHKHLENRDQILRSLLKKVKDFAHVLNDFHQHFFDHFAGKFVEKVEELCKQLLDLEKEVNILLDELPNRQFHLPFLECKSYLNDLLANMSLLSKYCFKNYMQPLTTCFQHFHTEVHDWADSLLSKTQIKDKAPSHFDLFNKLPIETLSKIIDEISWQDKSRLAQVNTRFKSMIKTIEISILEGSILNVYKNKGLSDVEKKLDDYAYLLVKTRSQSFKERKKLEDRIKTIVNEQDEEGKTLIAHLILKDVLERSNDAILPIIKNLILLGADVTIHPKRSYPYNWVDVYEAACFSTRKYWKIIKQYTPLNAELIIHHLGNYDRFHMEDIDVSQLSLTCLEKLSRWANGLVDLNLQGGRSNPKHPWIDPKYIGEHDWLPTGQFQDNQYHHTVHGNIAIFKEELQREISLLKEWPDLLGAVNCFIESCTNQKMTIFRALLVNDLMMEPVWNLNDVYVNLPLPVGKKIELEKIFTEFEYQRNFAEQLGFTSISPLTGQEKQVITSVSVVLREGFSDPMVTKDIRFAMRNRVNSAMIYNSLARRDSITNYTLFKANHQSQHDNLMAELNEHKNDIVEGRHLSKRQELC